LNNTVDNYLKSIIKKSNSYVKTDDLKNIQGIYEDFISFFDVSIVEIWKYDANSKNATLFLDNLKVVTITGGLSSKVIASKKAVFTNHVVSEKAYEPSVDNSSDYKLKSILICPIYKQERVVAFVKLYRNIDNKKIFRSQDITNLNLFIPIISKMLECHFIDSDELRMLLQEKKTKKSIKPIAKTAKKEVVSHNHSTLESKKIEELQSGKEELIKKLEAEKKILQIKITTEEKRIQQLAQEKQELFNENEALMINLQSERESTLKAEYSLQKFTELEDENRVLKMNNKKILANNEYLQSRYTFLEKALSEKDEYSKLNEYLRKIYLANEEHEALMILFELSFFIQDFSKIPVTVEESVKKSNITSLLLKMSTFKENSMNNTKYNIAMVFRQIFDNCKTVLQQSNNELIVHVNDKTPVSLVFNAHLVESILTRFIIRVARCLQKKNKIDMSVDFSKKELNITLNFTIEKETKFIDLFQSNKDLLYDKSQLPYQFNAKLLHSFGGSINTSYKKDIYKFQLKVPALIIKV